MYQYEDESITSVQTLSTNSTAPSKLITRSSIDGLPTTIIGTGLGVYQAETTFISGTAFTDPYGIVYESPTPVWVYTDVIYVTASPTAKHSAYACPNPEDIKSSSGDEVSPYPSGFFLADNDSDYGWNSVGAISTTLPTQLRDWMASYAASDPTNTLTNLAQCKLGAGLGVPTAYIPYNEITATITTTSTMSGYYSTSDISSSVTQATSSPTSSTLTSTSTATSTSTNTTSRYTRITTKTSVTTITQTPNTLSTSQTSSTQTSTAIIKAVLVEPIASTTASTTSSISHTLSVTSTTTHYIVAGGALSTAAFSGGMGKIVVVMDWASASTSEGVGASAQTGTGTGTIQALADSTVTGVVQSSKTSGMGRTSGVDIWWIVGSVVLVGLGGF